MRIQNPVKHVTLTVLKTSTGGVFKNFTKFTGKHLCWSLFFNKVSGLEACNFIKKRLQHRCFPVNFVEFLRTSFSTKHLPLTASPVLRKWLTVKSSFFLIRKLKQKQPLHLFTLDNWLEKQMDFHWNQTVYEASSSRLSSFVHHIAEM